MFQSTHPHGVRHLSPNHYECTKCFNPRTHTGCDSHLVVSPRLPKCFNPRTHTGCDSFIVNIDKISLLSLRSRELGRCAYNYINLVS